MGKRLQQQNTVEALNGDRNPLKKEGRFFVLSWNRRNASSKGVDEINSWTIHGTKILYCDWLKAVVRECIPSVFFNFSLSPDSLAAASTYDSASVDATVTSQAKGFPFCHGIIRKDHLAFYHPVCKDLPALWRLEFQQRWKLGRRRHSKPDVWPFGQGPFCTP